MYLKTKRCLDFFVSFTVLLLIWFIFLIISVLIKIESPGPIIFKQKRIGKDKKEFYIYKFRTMKTDTPKDIPTHLLDNPDIYITKIGKFLRKTSLDELPQIFNILKGEMSIVGPRPALWNQYDLIELRDKYKANNITPGLTGWAQVNGRDELEIDVKAEYDGEYIEKMGFLFDIKIIFMTVFSVFTAKGVKEGKDKPIDKDGLNF